MPTKLSLMNTSRRRTKQNLDSRDSEHWLLSKGIVRHDEEIEKETQNIIDVFTETTGDTLSTDEKVTLVGFGTFQVANKKARRGVNPRKGARIKPGSPKKRSGQAGVPGELENE